MTEITDFLIAHGVLGMFIAAFLAGTFFALCVGGRIAGAFSRRCRSRRAAYLGHHWQSFRRNV